MEEKMDIVFSRDPKALKEKPDKEDPKTQKIMGGISNRLSNINNRITIRLSKLSETIFESDGSSHPWTPAIFNGSRNNENWIEQQLFAVDIDETITIQEMFEICKQYKIDPVFVYTTYSHTEDDHRFRVVFCMPFSIRDIQFRNAIQYSIQSLFEGDNRAKDEAHLLFGGQKVIYSSESIVYPHEILLAAIERIKVNSSKGNSARDVNTFCESIGLKHTKGEPEIVLRAIDENVPQFYTYQKIEGEPPSCYSIIYSTPIPFLQQNDPSDTPYSYDGVEMRECDYEIWAISFSSELKKPDKPEKSKYKNVKKPYMGSEREKSGSHDWNECRLFKDLLYSEEKLKYDQRFHIWSNMQREVGGGEKFIQTLRENKYPSNKIKSFEITNSYNYSDYAPQSCSSSNCQYYEICKPGKNILQKCYINGNRPVKLDSLETEKISLEEAIDLFREELINEIENDNAEIVIMTVPTGLGKSNQLIQLSKDYSILIAVPTHDLKNQHVNDYHKMHHEICYCVPDKLELKKEYQKQIDSYYKIGAPDLALATIRKYSTDQNIDSVDREKCERYLETLDNIREIDTTVVTTHDRLIFMNPYDIKQDVIVIDEDILESLLKSETCLLSDLSLLGNLLESKNDKDAIHEFISYLLKADSVLHQVPNNIRTIIEGENKRKDIEILASKAMITTNVVDLLGASYAKLNKHTGSHTLSYIRRRDLFMNKKIIILSATANSDIYRQLYCDKVREIRIDNIETKGKIYQYPRSFSRYQMTEHEEPSKSNKETIEKAQILINLGLPVICPKKFKDDFNAAMTYGATEGRNDLKGKSLICISTPHLHEDAYTLMALELGAELGEVENDELGFINIEHNGYRFRFQTYKNNDIHRMVQLHLIESELIQAVGRARHLREDCIIFLCSNLIIPGVDIINDFDEFVSLIEREVARKKAIEATVAIQVGESVRVLETEQAKFKEMQHSLSSVSSLDIFVNGFAN